MSRGLRDARSGGERDAADTLTVAVDGGLVGGLLDRRTRVRSWLGIPYAAAPLGERRWRPPQPVLPWTGVRPAHAVAAQCLQAPRAPDSVYAEYAGPLSMSEDCLYLNVWSAAPEANARWPVMVWFHGGAFQQGSGGNAVFVRGDLPQHGVVLVTFNYRLGPFGFMAHPALSEESGQGASGNYGLLDMAAALGWVRRNISAFGGDPSRVTIFGQSAGAEGVVDMMCARPTRGLFSAAIAHSFGVSRLGSLADAERAGAAFAERMGAPSIASLRALDGPALLAQSLAQRERFMPIVDGVFLELPVRDTFAAGAQQAVPFLTGWNADEGSTFAAMATDDAAVLRARLHARLGAAVATRAEAMYPSRTPAETRASSLAFVGDELFAWGVWRAARDQSRIAPTYLYHFAHPLPFAASQRFLEAAVPSELGAFHSAEYPYVFGSLDVLTRPWTDDDRRLADLMQTYWLQFAKTGDPNGGETPTWPRFDDAAPTMLQLAPEPESIEVPRREHLSLGD